MTRPNQIDQLAQCGDRKYAIVPRIYTTDSNTHGSVSWSGDNYDTGMYYFHRDLMERLRLVKLPPEVIDLFYSQVFLEKTGNGEWHECLYVPFSYKDHPSRDEYKHRPMILDHTGLVLNSI